MILVGLSGLVLLKILPRRSSMKVTLQQLPVPRWLQVVVSPVRRKLVSFAMPILVATPEFRLPVARSCGVKLSSVQLALCRPMVLSPLAPLKRMSVFRRRLLRLVSNLNPTIVPQLFLRMAL